MESDTAIGVLSTIGAHRLWKGAKLSTNPPHARGIHPHVATARGALTCGTGCYRRVSRCAPRAKRRGIGVVRRDVSRRRLAHVTPRRARATRIRAIAQDVL